MTDQTLQIVWHGRSWRLRVEKRTLADGRVIEQGYIEHPGSVVLVPLRQTPNGPEILMLRQYRATLRDAILELPAGTREEGEDWLLCAQRELREETGYRAENFTPLGIVWPAPGVSDELMKIYLATDLTPDPLPADDDEDIEVQAMPLAELLSMAQDGNLQDAKSIIGILRTSGYLQM